MKRFFQVTGLLVAVLLVVLVGNTLSFNSTQLQVPAVAVEALDEAAVLQRFSSIVRLQTVSPAAAEDFDPQPFAAMHAYLRQAYPLVHDKMPPQVVGAFTLLYHLPGSDSTLASIMLMAHMDVVPIEEATRDQWLRDPFSGAIHDGEIFGRGTIDNKASMTGILEALELLLAQGYAPQRGVYILFGHDEELGGNEGAALVAQQFEQSDVQLEFILDEGLAIADRLGTFDEPVALIGLSEKGSVSFELIARAAGGHSSQPPEVTSIGTLSRAIVALEAQKPAARLSGPVGLMFDTLAREMGFTMRALFANRWLTEPLLIGVLERNTAILPMMRTSTAPTILKSGVKSNVLPTVASAVVNFRLLPGDTIETIAQHVESVINNPSVEVNVLGGIVHNPSPVSDPQSASYKTIEKTIRQVYPGTVVAPGLVMGGTDSSHFWKVSDNTYSFVPFRINKDNVSTVHGINERLGVDVYLDIVRFYTQLLRNVAE
jgi:carboxypeptidase PM20D1